VTKTGARPRPVVQAALGTACISSSAVLITLANVGPATTAFYRCALPLPVLAVAEQRRHGPRPLASRGYAVLAGLFLAVNLVLWIHAIADVGAGAATVLGNLAVLFVAPLAWAKLHERPDWRYLVTLPVVLPGVVMVSGMAGAGPPDCIRQPEWYTGWRPALPMHAFCSSCGRPLARRGMWLVSSSTRRRSRGLGTGWRR